MTEHEQGHAELAYPGPVRHVVVGWCDTTPRRLGWRVEEYPDPGCADVRTPLTSAVLRASIEGKGVNSAYTPGGCVA